MWSVPTPWRSTESAPGPAPWREPVRGGHPSARIAALAGRAQLDAMLAGNSPSPPLNHLTGMTLTEVGDGTSTFALPLSPWLAGPDGHIPLGVLTIPADAAMACAIIGRLPAATGLTTSEMSVRQVRPVTPGGRLLARGEVLEMGPPAALAEVSVTDEAGVLIARGSSLCVTLALTDAPEPAAPEDHDEPGPDPYMREPAGDLAALTGMRCLTRDAGHAVFVLPATRWLCAPPPGRAQGGTVAMLAEAAITAAIRDASPPGTDPMPMEIAINYLRPLASDGRDARASATLVHAGRRIGMARAEVTDADGRLIAVAGGSTIATARA